MTYPITLWVCLMALTTPIILSNPIAPAPIDPAIKVKITSKGFTEISSLVTSGLGDASNHSFKYPVEISKDGLDFEGFATFDVAPTVVITAFSGGELHRVKREHHSVHPKTSWGTRDPEDGGINIKAKDFAMTIDLSSGDIHYLIHYTDVNTEYSLFFDQNEGQIHLKAIEAEMTGNVEIVKNGVDVVLTDAEANVLIQDCMDILVEKWRTQFQTVVEAFTQVLVIYEKALFDFRLTEDPQFKDGGVELSVVGRFVYDKDGTYKTSSIPPLEILAAQIDQWKTKDGDTTRKEDRYREKFVLYEDDTFPHTTALAAEGSDSAEAERRAQSSIIVTFGEDLFNSLAEVGIESGALDLTLTKDTLRMIAMIYNMGGSVDGTSDKLYVESIPDDATLRVKLNPYEGTKYMHLTEEGVEEQATYGLSFGGLSADYFFYARSKWLFRNGKLAYDIPEFFVEKDADEGYPKLLTTETLKDFFDAYMKRVEELLFSEKCLKPLTEISHNEGNFKVAFDFSTYERGY